MCVRTYMACMCVERERHCVLSAYSYGGERGHTHTLGHGILILGGGREGASGACLLTGRVDEMGIPSHRAVVDSGMQTLVFSYVVTLMYAKRSSRHPFRLCVITSVSSAVVTALALVCPTRPLNHTPSLPGCVGVCGAFACMWTMMPHFTAVHGSLLISSSWNWCWTEMTSTVQVMCTGPCTTPSFCSPLCALF